MNDRKPVVIPNGTALRNPLDSCKQRLGANIWIHLVVNLIEMSITEAVR